MTQWVPARTATPGISIGRGPQGRIRRLSYLRWHQPAPQVQDPGALIRPSTGDGLLKLRAYAGRRLRHSGFARYRVRRDRSMSARPRSPFVPEIVLGTST